MHEKNSLNWWTGQHIGKYSALSFKQQGIFSLQGTADRGLFANVEFFYGDRNQPADIKRVVFAFKPSGHQQFK